jgi:hypothetical protein
VGRCSSSADRLRGVNRGARNLLPVLAVATIAVGSGPCVFHPTDVMVVALGDGVGMAPLHELNVAFSSTLPSKEPCSLPAAGTNDPATAAAAPEAFSDHCGLVVRFAGD